jgi:hypothetical protein
MRVDVRNFALLEADVFRSRQKALAVAVAATLAATPLLLDRSPAGAGVVLDGTRLVTGIAGAEPSGEIAEAQLTPDRQWLVFSSDASNLVAGDTNNVPDVFYKNLATGVVTRIVGIDGTESDSDSYNPTICDDGSMIAFTTETDLWDIDYDFNGSSDVYILDRDADDDSVLDEAGATSLYRIGVDPSGIEADFGTYSGFISGDCTWVAFATADPLAGASDANDSDDVYVRHTDPAEEYLRRVSAGASPTGGGGLFPTLSYNGRHVVYGSFASDIAPGGDGFKFGYYLRDRDADNDAIYDETGAGKTDEYVSKSTTGVVSTGGPDLTGPPSITPDGRCVAFRFYNGFTLDPPLSSTAADAIYVRDRTANTTNLVSVNEDGFTATDTLRPAISSDCKLVSFDVQDQFFGATNPSTGRDVFVRDLAAGTLNVMSAPGDGSAQFGSSQSTQMFTDGAVMIISSNTKIGGASGGLGARDPFLVEAVTDSVAPSGVALFGLNATYSVVTDVAVRWRASDNSGPPTIKVNRRIAEWNGRITNWNSFAVTTGNSSKTAVMKNGQTNCFKSQASDAAGNKGPIVVACTSLPLTSKSLAFSSGHWKTTKTTRAFGGQYVGSKVKGATFTRTLIRGTRIALVVTKCKGCGTVDIYWNNRRIKSNVNLNDTKSVYKSVIEVAKFARPTAGTLKVVVTSSNKNVLIEGVGVYTPLK